MTVPTPVLRSLWSSSLNLSMLPSSPGAGGLYQQQPRYGPSLLWMVIHALSSLLSSTIVTLAAISVRANTAIPPPPLFSLSFLQIFSYPSSLNSLSPLFVNVSLRKTTCGTLFRKRIAATTLAAFVLNPRRLQCKSSKTPSSSHFELEIPLAIR